MQTKRNEWKDWEKWIFLVPINFMDFDSFESFVTSLSSIHRFTFTITNLHFLTTTGRERSSKKKEETKTEERKSWDLRGIGKEERFAFYFNLIVCVDDGCEIKYYYNNNRISNLFTNGKKNEEKLKEKWSSNEEWKSRSFTFPLSLLLPSLSLSLFQGPLKCNSILFT